MSSNFTLSQMRTGLTMPIKLRNIIQRSSTGQHLAFNKLAELISSNFLARKSNKENRDEQKVHKEQPKETKNIRINSVKQPSRPKSIQLQQQCFTEFFQSYAPQNEQEDTFKPYRQQETYVSNTRLQHTASIKTRKKASTLNKKYNKAQTKNQNAKSHFGEWQFEEENSTFSILLKHKNYD